MRIVFMGTPDFAVPSLRKLVEDAHEIVGVFTQPDKPKGRGYQLVAPPVKEAAQELGLDVYQPAKMKDGEAMKIIQQLFPDLIAVVAYGKILPKDILDFPKFGCINVHGSLLPKYRGAAPIQWSVIEGEEVTGITTMFMAEGLDTGDMILKKETPIDPNETYGELHDRLMIIGADALSETVKLLAKSEAPRTKQNDDLSCYAKMLDKEIAKVDFSKPVKEIHNLIRGLCPAPVAYTYLDSKRLKLYRSRIITDFQENFETAVPGQLLDKKRFIVACGDGVLELLEVQIEGSKRMNGTDFLRGRKVSSL